MGKGGESIEQDTDREESGLELNAGFKDGGEDAVVSRRKNANKVVRKAFNQFESTDSDAELEDVFSGRLVDLIVRDFSRLNLQLLKGVIMKPSVKQLKR